MFSISFIQIIRLSCGSVISRLILSVIACLLMRSSSPLPQLELMSYGKLRLRAEIYVLHKF